MSFDPDKLHLTKEQIMTIGDRLVEGWLRVKRPGYQRRVLIAKFAKWYVSRQRPEDIEQYYKDFLKEVFLIMQENSLNSDPALSMLKNLHEQKIKTKTTAPKRLEFSIDKALAYGAMQDD